MPKKKEPPLDAREQRKRFEELARKSGATPSSNDLKKIVGRVALAKPSKRKPRSA